MSYGSRRIRDYTRASGFVQTVPLVADGSVPWTFYNGVLAANTLPTPAQIAAMTPTIATGIAGTFNFTGASGNYLFIAVPKYFGTITTFTGDITQWTLLTPSPAITIDSVTGLKTMVTGGSTVTDHPLELNVNGVLTEYNIYVSNTTAVTATPSITTA